MKVIEVATKELGDAINQCDVPDRDELMMAAKEDPINWNALLSYSQSLNQPTAFIDEQYYAI
eukprot:1396851-Ditylum_brightwellii.AAC.1